MKNPRSNSVYQKNKLNAKLIAYCVLLVVAIALACGLATKTYEIGIYVFCGGIVVLILVIVVVSFSKKKKLSASQHAMRQKNPVTLPPPLTTSTEPVTKLLLNKQSFIACTIDLLNQSLKVYDTKIASSLNQYFKDMQNIVESCAELGVREAADTIGRITTQLLNCSDAHNKANRTLYYWGEGSISLLSTFNEVLKTSPCIDGDVLPKAVFDDGLRAMQEVVTALMDCIHLLTQTQDLAYLLLQQLTLMDKNTFQLTAPEEYLQLKNTPSPSEYIGQQSSQQLVSKSNAATTSITIHDINEYPQVRANIHSFEQEIVCLPSMIEHAKKHIMEGLGHLKNLELDKTLQRSNTYDWGMEHLDASLTSTLLQSSSALVATCKQFQQHHRQFAF